MTAPARIRYALCGLCGRQIGMKKNGTFRQHQAWLGTGVGPGRRGVQFPPPCRGAGCTPASTAELQSRGAE